MYKKPVKKGSFKFALYQPHQDANFFSVLWFCVFFLCEKCNENDNMKTTRITHTTVQGILNSNIVVQRISTPFQTVCGLHGRCYFKNSPHFVFPIENLKPTISLAESR